MRHTVNPLGVESTRCCGAAQAAVNISLQEIGNFQPLLCSSATMASTSGGSAAHHRLAVMLTPLVDRLLHCSASALQLNHRGQHFWVAMLLTGRH
jgi:hypothetical protein